MDETKATQSTTASAKAAPVGQLDARRAADHHVLNTTAAVDEYADLAADLRREFGHRACEVICDQAIGIEPPSTKSFKGLRLACLETAGVAVNLDGDRVVLLGRNGRAAAQDRRSGAERLIPRPEPQGREACREWTGDSPNLERVAPEGRLASPIWSRAGVEFSRAHGRRPESTIRNTLHECVGVAAPLRSRDGCKLGCASADQNGDICCFPIGRPGSLTDTVGLGPMLMRI